MANIQAEIVKFLAKQKGLGVERLVLGVCKPSPKINASKFVVVSLKLDENLYAYFKHADFIYAHDPNKICKTGDIALIRPLQEKKTVLITHEVLKVVYPLGDVTCPLTKKKVVNTKSNEPRYREDLEKLWKVYGDNPARFKYDEAPPRGWQEGKRDFSDKEVLPKFYEGQPGDPYLYNV